MNVKGYSPMWIMFMMFIAIVMVIFIAKWQAGEPIITWVEVVTLTPTPTP